jgi:hypothetical protein
MRSADPRLLAVLGVGLAALTLGWVAYWTPTGKPLYVNGHVDKRNAETAKGLTLDEARRIATKVAKLPELLGKGR